MDALKFIFACVLWAVFYSIVAFCAVFMGRLAWELCGGLIDKHKAKVNAGVKKAPAKASPQPGGSSNGKCANPTGQPANAGF